MISYNSIVEIKKDFQIDSDNLETMRDKLNEIRANNHPDKSQGKFKDKESEILYHKANSAITYIDSVKKDQSLVAIEKMTELMKAFTDLIPNKQNYLEQSLESKISNTIKSYRSKFFLPKISITVFTAIVTFLFFIPNQIKDNPALSPFIDPSSGTFTIFWILLLFSSIILWIVAFMSDERSKRQLSMLNIDSFQNKIFEEFLHLESERVNEFSKEGLTHFIYSYNNCKGSNLGVRSSIIRNEVATMEISQNVAEIIIARLDRNKLIRKVTHPTLYDTYELLDYNLDF